MKLLSCTIFLLAVLYCSIDSVQSREYCYSTRCSHATNSYWHTVTHNKCVCKAASDYCYNPACPGGGNLEGGPHYRCVCRAAPDFCHNVDCPGRGNLVSTTERFCVCPGDV